MSFLAPAKRSAVLCREYRDTVKHCFMDDGHLRFELRKPEAQNLCRIFERNSPGYTPATTPSARPTPTIAPAGARPGAAASGASAAATSRQQQQPAATSGKQAVPGEDFIEVSTALAIVCASCQRDLWCAMAF